MSISSTSHEASDYKNNEQVASRSHTTTRQKKREWEDKLKSPSHIHIKDPNGIWIDCKYCNTRLGVRRPYNNEYWNRHAVIQSHLDQVNKQYGIPTITNYFLPTKISVCKTGVNDKVVTRYTQKQYPGHEILTLIRMYGKYDDIDVKFVDAEGAEGVKALHENCNGKYTFTTKKVEL